MITRKDGSCAVTEYSHNSQRSATIVLMYGSMDSVDGLRFLGERWASLLPNILSFFPTAHTQWVTLNGGMSMTPVWHNIVVS